MGKTVGEVWQYSQVGWLIFTTQQKFNLINDNHNSEEPIMWQKMRISFFLFLLICHCGINDVLGGPIPQTFILQSGWNAIFLEVEPDNTDPETLFSAINPQLVSVWKWNSNSSSVEFIQNPNELTPDHPNYLTYLPGNPLLTNLHAIHGNGTYLIQMSGPATLTVTGEPLPPRIDWKSNSFNMVGFHLSAGAEPFYADFFGLFPEFQDANGDLGEIYYLDNGTGLWQQVIGTEQMVKGEAIWVYCRGSSQFAGPFSLTLEQGQSLDFDTILTTQDIVLKNIYPAIEGPVGLQVSTESLISEWLYYWQLDPATGRGQWFPLPEVPTSLALTIDAGEIKRLRLGVKRSMLLPDEQVFTNIRIEDGAGTEVLVPVSVTGVGYGGLWVGEATLNKVNEVHDDPHGIELMPTGSEFSFRIIIHVDYLGTVRLLNQVIQMWEVGSGSSIAPVLFTDESYISDLETPFLRDGREVGRRISAPAFGYFLENDTRVHHKTMAGGSFGIDGNSLTVDLDLPENDPTNPFVHRYNPEHLEPGLETPDEKRFPVNRTITITFGDEENGVNFIGWGSSDVGGDYEETITGLHKDPVIIGGSFRLHKVSSVERLLDDI